MSKVQKYEMSAEQYENRTDSVRYVIIAGVLSVSVQERFAVKLYCHAVKRMVSALMKCVQTTPNT